MLTRVCIGLLVLSAAPVWSQVEASATGPSPSSDDPMQVPASVSGQAYPTTTGSETRSNFLSAAVYFQTAYDDNVLGLGTNGPVSDTTYTIRPTVAFDQVISRLHETFTYAPAFTLYQHTSARNEADQNASATLSYRLSPHIAMNLSESFQKTTNVFDQPFAGVSGSNQGPTVAVVAPFAEQIHNSTGGELSYQFSRNGMIGGSGSLVIQNYPNPAQASGLSNSNSHGGAAFFNLRLKRAQYTGVTYQYSTLTSSLEGSTSGSQTHTIDGFYTLYLTHALSLNISGGPQYSVESQAPFPPSGSWGPSVTGSMSWQTNRTDFAASYSKMRSGDQGLEGIFSSTTASASARRQLARTWTVGANGNYAISKSVSPLAFLSSPGGHSISGTATVQHSIGERYTAECGYARMHQSFGGLGTISEYPDSNREYISISYQLRRQLGR